MMQGTNLNNPKEMAHHILQQVLNWTGEEPEDDMIVLVVGVWKRHFFMEQSLQKKQEFVIV